MNDTSPKNGSEKLDKHEVLEKAGEVAKNTQHVVDQWGAGIQKGLAILGSYQAPVVVGVLISFFIGGILHPGLFVPVLLLVVITLIAKNLKSG